MNMEKMKKMRIDPKPFIEENFVSHNSTYRAIINFEHQITKAQVVDLVQIEGMIATPISGVNPNVDAWFLIDCRNMHGAAFWLVTDGENWIPYDRKKKRLCRVTKPTKSVCLDRLNQVDQEILQMAIYHYINDGGRAANTRKEPRKVLHI